MKLDGTDVTWREAILRQIIAFVLTIFASIMTIYALSMADGEYYESLGWMQKQQYLFGLTPILFKIYTWTNNIWVYSELFVLLFNKRRRAEVKDLKVKQYLERPDWQKETSGEMKLALSPTAQILANRYGVFCC